LFAALVLAVPGALLVTSPVTAADPFEHLDATLTGEQEVPGPGDPNGSGDAHVNVISNKVCYALLVEDIRRPTAAHIHEGRRGEAGPVVVELNTPTRVADAVYFSEGCERISRELSRYLRMNPTHYLTSMSTTTLTPKGNKGPAARLAAQVAAAHEVAEIFCQKRGPGLR
jgi:hypothetical protein